MHLSQQSKGVEMPSTEEIKKLVDEENQEEIQKLLQKESLQNF